MLCVGGAAAVAAKEESSTSAYRAFNESKRDIELGSELGGDTIRQCREIAEGVGETGTRCRRQWSNGSRVRLSLGFVSDYRAEAP